MGRCRDIRHKAIGGRRSRNVALVQHYSVYPAWQNYKHIGVTETVDVTSAFGLAYPLTIRNVPSMYHSAATPTSFRMQWPLAKTLWAVSNNSSGVGGSSLVRSSPVYAFGNASSMEALLARNQTVEFPLGWRLALTRQTFGPFGTVVMTRVEPPLALRALYRELTEAIVGAIGHNATTLHAYMSVRKMSMFTPCTMAWRYQCTVGGNFMCDGGKVLTREMSEFFALDGSCSSNGNDQTLNNGHTTMAAVLSQAVRGDELVQSTCAHETLARPSCEQVMQQGLAFIASTPLLSSTLAALADVTQATKRTIQATLAPQVVQFTWDCQVGSATALSHIGVFDEPTFEFFAWLYMFEWVLGYREVVQFTGASKPTMTVVSGRPLVMRFDVNSQEIPQNMAFYIRCTIQYFTIVLLAIAVGVCISIVLSRGYIEGMNMFQFNRVAALVWIGRPLVLLRGVTAVCILSTATLRLDLPAMGGTFTQFVSGPPDTMTTLLSCGEMGWVVYILNDVFSVMTGQVTSRYAWKSSVGVWLAASVWSLVSPVRHAVSIDRQCTADVVDFTLSCHSATFEIGQVDRFVGLLGLAGVGCVVSYAIERGLGSRGANTQISKSLLLHSVAQFQFEQTPWLCGGMYYLDRASAMLNGLLSIRAPNGAYLVMDVKTWQWFVVPVPDTPCTPMPPSFVHAIPLAN
ncbi:hypothetical protein H310_13029 [Aphanomyces invadans]|uniref:Transmembrane protein n=1 Tax=Aphanomyces invadans TaxID=157072 RepID=A0A024THK5_9STRA|nr:hypothetical protein H310_13029 [Aphanomyces invadans]ETV92822.1 hypothetical protein H310_13029 [Aphanomyces invadans]|eukprot:XP_008878592.1 hypothetical protein H310_13029 [Aphanomyces invadans]